MVYRRQKDKDGSMMSGGFIIAYVNSRKKKLAVKREEVSPAKVSVPKIIKNSFVDTKVVKFPKMSKSY